MERLSGEDYLGDSREAKIDAAMVEFENRLKRTVDVTKIVPGATCTIPGLRGSKVKRFTEHNVLIQQ